MLRLALILALAPWPARADVVLAARTIRPQEVIAPSDLLIGRGEMPGAHQRPEDVVGQEARVVLYAGRPVQRGDVGAPALVERNQVVPMLYAQSGLIITTEGRVLERAGLGETIRVMNLSSRSTVNGRVQPDGSIRVIQ